MNALANKPNICVVCRCRDDALGVGEQRRISWFCETCGPDRAKVIHHMSQKDLDAFEKRALERVRSHLMEGDLTVPDEEIVPFLEWLIQTFGEEVKKDIDNGGAPF